MPRAVTTNTCGLPPGSALGLPLTITRRLSGVPVLIQSFRRLKRSDWPGESSLFSKRILPRGPALRTASRTTGEPIRQAVAIVGIGIGGHQEVGTSFQELRRHVADAGTDLEDPLSEVRRHHVELPAVVLWGFRQQLQCLRPGVIARRDRLGHR